MDSLSYLIENNNDVIIDEKLLHDLEVKNQQVSVSPSVEALNKNQPPKVTRKYSPMNRPIKRSPQGHKILKTETTKTQL